VQSATRILTLAAISEVAGTDLVPELALLFARHLLVLFGRRPPVVVKLLFLLDGARLLRDAAALDGALALLAHAADLGGKRERRVVLAVVVLVVVFVVVIGDG
jgi:hypothetical protein